jgi:hypothetical protein
MLAIAMSCRSSPSSQIFLHALRFDATEDVMTCGWTYAEPLDPLAPSTRIALATARWLDASDDPAASAEHVATAKARVDEETRQAFDDVARAQAVQAMQARLQIPRRETERPLPRRFCRLPARRCATRAPRRARRARHTAQAVARGSPADDGPEPPISFGGAAFFPPCSREFARELRRRSKRRLTLGYLNGAGEPFRALIPVLYAFAAPNPKVWQWIVTRRFELAAGRLSLGNECGVGGTACAKCRKRLSEQTLARQRDPFAARSAEPAGLLPTSTPHRGTSPLVHADLLGRLYLKLTDGAKRAEEGITDHAVA